MSSGSAARLGDRTYRYNNVALHHGRVPQKFYSVTREEQCLRAWSTKRLPFEPTGWQREYRNELRSELRAMTAEPTSILYAEYATPDDEFADLENVLLYNLGSGCYAHLARQGIICRRTPSTDQLHHVRYASTDPATVTAPSDQLFAKVRLIEAPTRRSAAHWWAALRQQLPPALESPYREKSYDGEFGIRAELGSAWKGDIAASVKAFLDGLVAALHVHDGSERRRVTAALSTVGDGDRLWTLLNDPAAALLGRRQLVRPHRQGIAWCPADERCGYFELVRSRRDEAVIVAIVALPRAT